MNKNFKLFLLLRVRMFTEPFRSSRRQEWRLQYIAIEGDG